MSLDLSAPIRAAIVAESSVTAALPAYLDSYPVFTRVPVPDDAPYPMVVVHAQLDGGNRDGINDQQPTIICDLSAYGRNDTAAHYRVVEALGHSLRDMFHRKRGVLSVSGWGVTDILATAPSPAPVDDEQTVGRRVELTVMLARAN